MAEWLGLSWQSRIAAESHVWQIRKQPVALETSLGDNPKGLVSYVCQLSAMFQMAPQSPKTAPLTRDTKQEPVRDTSHSSRNILPLVPIGSWLLKNTEYRRVPITSTDLTLSKVQSLYQVSGSCLI